MNRNLKNRRIAAIQKDPIYQKIQETFRITGSISTTANALGTSPNKVRRVLITEGLWANDKSNRVKALYDQGLSVHEIAQEMDVSENCIMSYLPYGTEKRTPGQSEASKNWQSQRAQKSIDEDRKTEQYRRVTSLLEDLTHWMPPYTQSERKLLNQQSLEGLPLAYKLKLELDTSELTEKEMAVLKRHAAVKKGISREIIVPGNMTLHALHYAIQRMFGWWDYHLRSFELPLEDFEAMTEGGFFGEYARLCGVYFLFAGLNPSSGAWNETYQDNIYFKSWLRGLYTAPYRPSGQEDEGEAYLGNQYEIREFYNRFPMIRTQNAPEAKGRMPGNALLFHPSGTPDMVPSDQASIRELDRSILFDGSFNHLLERLEIRDILLMAGQKKPNHEQWRVQMNEKLKPAEKLLEDRLDTFDTVVGNFMELDQLMQDDPSIEEDVAFTNDTKDHLLRRYLVSGMGEIVPLPYVNKLHYFYDYGDNWKINITCTESYYGDLIENPVQPTNKEWIKLLNFREGILYPNNIILKDQEGKPLCPKKDEVVREVFKKMKPICVKADGAALLEDVGGIVAYAEFIKEMYESYDISDREARREWARGQNWKNRPEKLEKML